jgi:hypothetical protein
MKPQSRPRAYSDNEVVRLAWIGIFISVFSLMFYNRSGEILLYGDAVAHINIARRVFDSKTPGLLQLGTVWLPLQHLLIIPFIISNKMWQTGIGGSFPSMAAFVFGTLGIFCLMRLALARNGQLDDEAKVWSWLPAIIYAANPNLIYMQATAMNESLYLAFFVWAVVYFTQFAQAAKTPKENSNRSFMKCGLCLFAACLTRYDGWFLAALLIIAAIAIVLTNSRKQESRAPSRSSLVTLILLAVTGPVLWFAYNAAVYRNPLEFANGPYSPKAIQIKTATVNPAKGNPLTGGSYFLKAAELNVSESSWQGRLWLFLALIGGVSAIFSGRGRTALFLWTPLPFYAFSVAYGSVPIFVPTWWPFSFYNLRYGLELLPAFAIFVPLGISFLVQSIAKILGLQSPIARWSPVAAVVACIALIAATDVAVWRADPVCYREAAINSRGRIAIDKQLATWFTSFPPSTTLLMYLGEHSGALEEAGIPLRRVINEGNHRVWKQPSDPEGLWERALADPAAYADYAIGFQGDPVWKAATEKHLPALVEIHTTGQPAAAIFQTHLGK